MEITNKDDLRVGDTATFTYDGHEFTGPLWEREKGTLFIGSEGVLYEHWSTGEIRWSNYYEFVSGTREAPALPTEPGAVILVTECRGERADKPVVAWWDDVETYWLTPTRRFGGMTTHDSPDITEWTPAKVVPG